MSYRVADLFCGAGGSSSGARQVLGDRMQLTAVNHCDVAIDTHSRNHPSAVHHCSNVYRLAPRDAVPSGRLDLLMASPTCTFHSRARGGKPISRDQRYGRMTPTQVVRWADELKARTLLIENVPEFVQWGPVHVSTPRMARCLRAKCLAEKPCRARRGTHFRAWIRKLERLGYALEWRILNAADYGDATTRRRFFLLGRRDGRAIRWPRPTHSRDGGSELFDGLTSRWRGAREVIDWSLPGKSVFHRKKPLAPNTMRRIYAGALRFRWPEPFLVVLRQHMSARGLDVPLPTLTAGGTHVGLAQPFFLPQRSDRQPHRTTDDPSPGITTVSRIGLVQPFHFANQNNNVAKGLADPVPSMTTGGALSVVQPFLLGQQSGGAPRGAGQPVPTLAARGAHALVAPYYGNGECTSPVQPLPTVTTRDRFAFVVPAFGERTGQAPRTHSLDRPAPTITATGRQNLVRGVEGYDVLFRMLQPGELAAAMGFPPEYDFAGNKGEVTRQIGNAVAVNTARALVAAIVEAGAA